MKDRFRYTIWFMISEKGITRQHMHVPSPWWCKHAGRSLNKQDIQKNFVPEFPKYMNRYILTEGRNSKIFSKENYAVALDSCLAILLY